jgi:FkbM family methyltransferase
MSEFIFQDEIDALNYLKLPDNAVIFDVGCSYGEYTEEVIRKMNGRPFTVHCFEPVADLCEKQKFRFKDLPNIKINCLALCEGKTKMEFFRIKAPTNQGAEGCSSLTLRPEFVSNHWPYVKIEVETDTLDNYIGRNKITHIDLMKIDVEGAEYRVFQGAKNMFKNEIVDIIQFEYCTALRDAGYGMKNIIDFIYDYNYFLADFRGGEYIELTEFKEDYGHHNFYLINKTYFDEN